MSKAFGLSMYDVRGEHVDEVVRFGSGEAAEALRPGHVVGRQLTEAVNDARFVASAQCEVDFSKMAPAMGLMTVGQVATVGRTVEAANNARLLRASNEPA